MSAASKPSELIREARLKLFEKGWTQHTNRDRATGAICALQAVDDAVGGRWDATAHAVEAHLRDAVGGDVMSWNDRTGRAFDEVVDAFDRAEKFAEIEEAK